MPARKQLRTTMEKRLGMTMLEAFGMTSGKTARNGVFCHSEEEVFGCAERFDEESKKIKGKEILRLAAQNDSREALRMTARKRLEMITA